MAIEENVGWIETQNLIHHARTYRAQLGALTGVGVARAGDLAVTERSGTTDMSVDVAPGVAFVEADDTVDGRYAADWQTVTNLPMSPSDATNPRIDLVVVEIHDPTVSGVDEGGELRIVEGTPAAVPDEPTVDADLYLVLAAVDVAANATSISDADIEDRRPLTPQATQAGQVSQLFGASGTPLAPLLIGEEVLDSPSASSPLFTVPDWVQSCRLEFSVQRAGEGSGNSFVYLRVNQDSSMVYDGVTQEDNDAPVPFNDTNVWRIGRMIGGPGTGFWSFGTAWVQCPKNPSAPARNMYSAMGGYREGSTHHSFQASGMYRTVTDLVTLHCTTGAGEEYAAGSTFRLYGYP